MVIFGTAQRWGGGSKKVPSLPKIRHIYPTMMRLGAVIPYLTTSKKYMDHVTHPMKSADISILLLEISKFCYIKKYRHRLHFTV